MRSTTTTTVTLDGHRRRQHAPSSRHPARSSPSADSSTPTKRATTRSAATPTRPRTRPFPPLAVGDVLRAQGRRAEGPRHQPQAALHRGEPRQGARGEGHRPPLDVREHHRRHPQSRLRHQARPGAHPELARVQRRAPARGALRRPRRLRLHRGARRRPRCDRPRRAEARRLAEGFYFGSDETRSGCATSSTTSARSTRAPSTRRPSATSPRCASASTARTSRSPTRRIRPAIRVG